MPSNREKRLDQQRKRREAPLEAPKNEAPDLKPLPDRIFICRVPGHLCSLSRLEFIKCLEACNRANVWFSDRKDLRKAQEIIG